MRVQRVSIIAICLSLFMACSPAKKEEANNEETAMDEPTETEQATAVATLNSASGSSVTGAAHFTQIGDKLVHMALTVQGLTPGEHALHLHQNGDCSAPDATSAGGHWNPTGMPHGKRGEGEFHAGDIINLTAGEDGNVSWENDIMGWTIGGSDSTNIVGHGIIIHSGVDDFTSQPSGAAGSRVACGVITEGSM